MCSSVLSPQSLVWGLLHRRRSGTFALAYQDASRPRTGPSPPDLPDAHNFDLLSAQCADTGAIERRLPCLILYSICQRVHRLSNSANKQKNYCETIVNTMPPLLSAFVPPPRDLRILHAPTT